MCIKISASQIWLLFLKFLPIWYWTFSTVMNTVRLVDEKKKKKKKRKERKVKLKQKLKPLPVRPGNIKTVGLVSLGVGLRSSLSIQSNSISPPSPVKIFSLEKQNKTNKRNWHNFNTILQHSNSSPYPIITPDLRFLNNESWSRIGSWLSAKVFASL